METLTRKDPSIARHLTPKSVIIRCPSCGSSDVVIGLTTKTGTRIFCQICAEMTEVRRGE